MESDMTNFFQRFLADESGAVTVDWVVICAAVVGIGIAVATQMEAGLKNVAQDISTDVATQLNAHEGVKSGTYTDK